MFPSTFVRYFPNAKEDKVLLSSCTGKCFFLLPHHFLEHLKHYLEILQIDLFLALIYLYWKVKLLHSQERSK